MIQHSIVQEVKRLLAEGNLSQRKIAKRIGLSRATVGAIASGKRPDYKQRPPSEDDLFQPTGPSRRCSGCGGVVYLPCRLCYVRDIKRREEQQARRRTLLSQGRFEEINRPRQRPFTSMPAPSPLFTAPAEPRPPRDTRRR